MLTTTHSRTCPFCEATCGLLVEMNGERVRRVRGDREHPESRGFLCPKASGLGWLHDDPDRIRRPLLRTAEDWREVDWDEAFAYIDDRSSTVLAESGLEGMAAYIGNPASYDLALSLYGPTLFRMARQRFSPATVDTFPKQFANGHMYGGEFTIPVPDLERTQMVWILGANPAASNGSLMVTPDVVGRLKGIQQRGGKVIVFDPRRTATAEHATEYHAIRPGTDSLFLAAVIHTLFGEELAVLRHLEPITNGANELQVAVGPFSPEAVSDTCGIRPAEIRRLTREFAKAESGVAYGRLGTCTQEFGTIASWLIEAVNVLTGNLDRPGGAMFAWPLTGSEVTLDGPSHVPRRGRWHSRVRNVPEVMGEFPVAVLSEEILTAGPGQVRLLLTIAGNPALSVPDPRISEALGSLDLHIAHDLYLNETSSRAHVVLPGESHLQRPHFPLSQHSVMTRQVAKWSEPVLAPDPDRPRDWEIMLRLAAILGGRGLAVPTEVLDDEHFNARVVAEVRRPGGRLHGRSVNDIIAQSHGRGPERVVDLLVRSGPFGDLYGRESDGLTLAKIKQHPHGLDLGGLEPRLPGALSTGSGRIELAPGILVAELPKLAASMEQRPTVQLIGRRDLRTNNSWMHNLPGLARGKDRSRLLVSPSDANRIGLMTGGRVRVRGALGEVTVDVEVDAAMMPGVVSLPHGWGHDEAGTRLSVAARRPGTNANLLTDPSAIDSLTGTSVVNGVEVEILAVQDDSR